MANFRRSQRYPFQLDILLKGTYRNTPTTTEDVSFHGVFIRSDEERAPNQLLKFIVVDPRNGEHLEMLGIVARCVSRAEATSTRPPGVGVSLFGNDRGTEARWVAVMRQVKMWVERGLRTAPPIRPDETFEPAIGGNQSTLVGVPRPTVGPPTPIPAMGVVRPSASTTPGGSRTIVAAPPVLPPLPAMPQRGPSAPPPPAPPPSTPTPGGARFAPLPTGSQHAVLPRLGESTPPPVGSPAAPPARAVHVSPSSTGANIPQVPHGIDATKRAHERRPAKFNVTLRPDGLAALEQFEAKDISEGGTFVLTQTLIPVGSRVNLRLVHPQTGETFQIAGIVARAVDALDEGEKGIGLRFDTDTLDRHAWAEFVGRLLSPRRDSIPPAPVEPVPGVRVLRGRTDPPILLGVGETPVTDGALNDAAGSDAGLPPVILDGRERPVPVLLGSGLATSPGLPPRKA